MNGELPGLGFYENKDRFVNSKGKGKQPKGKGKGKHGQRRFGKASPGTFGVQLSGPPASPTGIEEWPGIHRPTG